MASDRLTQVGKDLRQTKENAEYALNRLVPIRRSNERVRDIFDPENSFEMHFKVNKNNSKVKVDLFFNKPPPLRACADLTCEMWTLFSGSPQIITLTNTYESGSVLVFINGTQTTAFSEENPAGGQVKILSGLTKYSNSVSVCYQVGV